MDQNYSKNLKRRLNIIKGTIFSASLIVLLISFKILYAPTITPHPQTKTVSRNVDTPSSVGSSSRKPASPHKDSLASGCFEITYEHKSARGHSSKRDCAKHRNLISLGALGDTSKITWKTACLRVDGVPTAFEKTAGGIVFSPGAGPSSIVTLRYCQNKSACPSTCVIPRDEFLDAIGVLDNPKNPNAVAVAQWDPANHAEDPDPTAAVEAELREVMKAPQGIFISKDWTAKITKPVCLEKQVAEMASRKDHNE